MMSVEAQQVSGSRKTINTPALVLDLDSLERNIAAMAAAMAAYGRGLRPHVKSHKCSRIARLQIQAGAVGLSCATLDELEMMAKNGLPGLLLTSPITTAEKIARFVAIIGQSSDAMLVVDDPMNVRDLARAASAAGVEATLLIDIDPGIDRTGVSTAQAAIELAHLIGSERGVRLAGVQAYAGQLQHIADYQERLAATSAVAAYVAQVVGSLEAAGFAAPIVTGGGTGTYMIDGGAGPFTEIQAGSYPLMDADYGVVAHGEQRDWPFKPALLVQSAVVSLRQGAVTLDAGVKAIALNGPPPYPLDPTLAGSTFEFAGDEHGRLTLGPGCATPRVGDRVELVSSHCDPTVAMYDRYYCVRGDRLVDVWPIDARGRHI